MRIALDVHGCIDKDPKFFRDLAQAVIHADGEIHILTGKHIANGIMEELDAAGFAAGIHYTHLFSVSDYHKERGTQMWGTLENPWMDDVIWSNTKADYCRYYKIDLCIDDTARYIPYFTTGVALYRKGNEAKTYPVASKFLDDHERQPE